MLTFVVENKYHSSYIYIYTLEEGPHLEMDKDLFLYPCWQLHVLFLFFCFFLFFYAYAFAAVSLFLLVLDPHFEDLGRHFSFILATFVHFRHFFGMDFCVDFCIDFWLISGSLLAPWGRHLAPTGPHVAPKWRSKSPSGPKRLQK